jgi:hypothetical protein
MSTANDILIINGNLKTYDDNYGSVSYSIVRQIPIVCTGTIKDGFNGHTRKIALVLLGNTAIALYTGSISGYVRISDRLYQDSAELLYYANWKGSELGSRFISVDPVIDQEFVDSIPLG